MSLVGLKYGWSLGGSMASKKESGANIQQVIGLIRYFDEESEDALRIKPWQVYALCVIIGGYLYLVNLGVISFIRTNLF